MAARAISRPHYRRKLHRRIWVQASHAGPLRPRTALRLPRFSQRETRRQSPLTGSAADLVRTGSGRELSVQKIRSIVAFSPAPVRSAARGKSSLRIRDFLGTGDLESLAPFERANELGRPQQRILCPRIEPGVAATHFLDVQPAAIEIFTIEVCDLSSPHGDGFSGLAGAADSGVLARLLSICHTAAGLDDGRLHRAAEGDGVGPGDPKFSTISAFRS